MKTLIVYKTTKTAVVINEPFIPNPSSDNGWARIFPSIKAMVKSIKRNWEIDLSPMTLVATIKKMNEKTALNIH